MQIKRYCVVEDYIKIYGDFIDKNIMSPERAFKKLAEKYELSRSGVRKMLLEAGVYQDAEHPFNPPSSSDIQKNPKYFLA